jgi:DNA processing protein
LTSSGSLDPGDPALRAWLRLQGALALQPGLAAESLRRTGDPVAALEACSGRAAAPPDDATLDAWIQLLRSCQARALPLLSRAYPPRLADLAEPAPLLLVQGDPGALARTAVAIVGARAASAYGREVARELAGELARRGVVVVSGLARGIDGEAHRAVLEVGGVTVAVQACGLDRVYPPEHRELAQEIRRRGAMLSELPPGTPPLPGFFPLRNRLIAGLATVVVVVEARERSGSLITARHALEQGGQAMAVPGEITAATSTGVNRLIRDGAPPVLGVEDVLDELGWPRAGSKAGVEAGAVSGSEEGREILSALRGAPATRNELGRRLGRSPEQLALGLVELEIEGLVMVDRDGRLRVRR